MLAAVGVMTPEELWRLGSVAASAKVKSAAENARLLLVLEACQQHKIPPRYGPIELIVIANEIDIA